VRIPLPTGLRESDRLEEPIFTPSTKAEIGTHDENISFEQMVSILGQEAAEELRRLSLDIYSARADHAATRGIIIADTKFEFGVIDGRTTLVDEVLTPTPPVLAGRRVRTRSRPALLRQAVRPRLA